MEKQIAGKLYTFIDERTGEIDSGVLPSSFGESNDFAYWRKDNDKWRSRKFALKNEELKRRVAGVPIRQSYQIPGKEYTFVHRRTKQLDTGILPDALGQSNGFARWIPNRRGLLGGGWTSEKFHKQSGKNWKNGTGPSGLLTRMKRLLSNSNYRIKNELGYATINRTAEQLLSEWALQNGKCAACDAPLDLYGASYDHNHETGEGRGFVHDWCNKIEGYMLRLGNQDFDNYIEWIKKIHNRSL